MGGDSGIVRFMAGKGSGTVELPEDGSVAGLRPSWDEGAGIRLMAVLPDGTGVPLGEMSPVGRALGNGPVRLAMACRLSELRASWALSNGVSAAMAVGLPGEAGEMERALEAMLAPPLPEGAREECERRLAERSGGRG